ncbi:MAG: AAA family ATPase [Bdellovibrionales bacterium]|nr:AAA family ATPase [Bdellovibrionales bacterium]
MAKIYSKKRPIKSEKKAYKAFYEFLSDEYTVFYSFTWSGKKAIHGSRDFECDFVVFHPEKGILVVEVKEKYYNPKYYTKKDPISQVIRNKEGLGDYLSRKFKKKYGRKPKLKMAHCVWFMNTKRWGDLFPFPLSEEDIILDRSSLDYLNEDIAKAYSFFDKEKKKRNIPKEDYKKLIELLLSPDLTQEQMKSLEFMRKNKKVFISGGVGTGKTLMGLKKAKEEADKENKVLFICYSRPFSDILAENNKMKNLTIINFHKFLIYFEYGGKNGKNLYLKENCESSDFWNERSIKILKDPTLKKKRKLLFDTIIIDEIQDFSPRLIHVIISEFIKDKKDGCIYLIGDKSQTVFKKGKFEEVIDSSFVTFNLLKNLRNTKEIFNFCDSFAKGKGQRPSGGDVYFIKSDNKDIQNLIKKEINKLVNEGIPLADITVLSDSHPTKCFPELCKNKKFTTDIFASKKVLMSTIQSFKGLENEALIVSDLKKIRADYKKELLYIACSRAKKILIVVGSDEELKIFNFADKDKTA